MKSLFSPSAVEQFFTAFHAKKENPRALHHLLAALSSAFLEKSDIRHFLHKELLLTMNTAMNADFNFGKFNTLIQYIDLNRGFIYCQKTSWGYFSSMSGTLLHSVIAAYAKAKEVNRNGLTKVSDLEYLERINKNFDLMLVGALMQPGLDKNFAASACCSNHSAETQTAMQLAEFYRLDNVSQLLQHWEANESATPKYN